MYQFISQLIERNREILKDEDFAHDEDIKSKLTTLAFAQNALQRLSLYESKEKNASDKAIPLQLVVAGPTQVGKSTVANLLLQQSLAESSAKAGFTVHCQGFHLVDVLQDRYAGSEHWASEYFGDIQLTPQNQLDKQVLSEYSLVETKSVKPSLKDTVVWDTPDFDSISSFNYRAPLVKAIALADLVVFVVSKEKYADRTVWFMFELLASMGVPFVVVMNKTPENVRTELKASLEKKFTSAHPGKDIPPISFIGEYHNGDLSNVLTKERDSLDKLVENHLQRPASNIIKDNTLSFIKHQWKGWTSSVVTEHRLQREYELLVENAASETIRRYRQEYIHSDRHREVIQLALSELLVLLEVPGLAKPLSKIRNVVTWPVRKLTGNFTEQATVVKDDRNEERRLLDELGKHTMAKLISSLAKKETTTDAAWWQDIRQQVTLAEVGIRSDYDKSLDNYQTMLQVEIDSAAQSLYQKLKEQPATLNSLRATRVTADAAAVVLAVKSGGLGAVDLVLAPAMLSLTTLLTEGALGKYMDRIQRQLTAYQEKEVQSVIDRKIAKPLLKFGNSQNNQTLISEEELQRMTEKLESGNV